MKKFISGLMALAIMLTSSAAIKPSAAYAQIADAVSYTSAKPSAVTDFKGTTTSSSVKLTWTKNTSADSYKIKQYVNGKWKELTKTSSNAITSYTVTGLKANTEYQFAIYAFRGTQFSAATKVTVKTKAASAKPEAVTNFKGTATSVSVKLTWTKNTGADSYKIKQLVNGKWKELTKTANNATTSYTVSGLKPNTEYQFAIYAFKGTQFSAAKKVTVKTTAAKPAAVTGFKGTPTSNSVKLTWTKNTGADSYKIKQLVNGKWKELTKTVNNATTSYTVSGLKPNTEYQFAIYAFKGTQFSAATKVTVKTTAAKPTVVTGFKGTPTSNSVKLTWTKNAGADSYKIKQLINGSWKDLTKTASNATTSYTVIGLKANTEYQFRIYAFKGTQFSTASTITVKTLSASSLAAVTGFVGTIENDVYANKNILLKWNRSTSAEGYIIKQYINGEWKELAKTKTNAITTYGLYGSSGENKFAIYAYKGSDVSDAAEVSLTWTEPNGWDVSILYDYKAKWGYNQLSANEQKAYERFFNAAQIHEETIELSDLNLMEADFDKIYWAFDYDNPQFLALGSGFSVSFYASGQVISSKILYNRTAEEIAEIQEQFDKIIEEPIRLAKIKSSNIDRMRVMHDWIINKTKYTSTGAKYESEADGPIIYGKAHCEGYSKAFMYLCQAVGIPCVCVSGGGHMWNIAQVNPLGKTDGYWAYFDVTWDDPVANTGEDVLRYDYFRLYQNQMDLKKGHVIENPITPPPVPDCI